MKNILLAALLAVAAAAFGQQKPPTYPAQQWQGKKMPSFAMTRSTGGTVSNASTKGKVTIVDFWATWCGPCRMMSQILDELYKAYHKGGLEIFGADAGEQRDGAIENWLVFHKQAYPVTLRNDALAGKLRVESFPTVFIIDRKGVVRKVQVGIGRTTPFEMEQLIRKLLAEKS